MHSINCEALGRPGEWWAETLFRTVTAPLWLAAMSPPPGQDATSSGPQEHEEIDLRSNGTLPRRIDDRDVRECARELERLRIAQQLHDDLGCVLTGLKACIVVSRERAAQAGLVPDRLLDDAAALVDVAFEAMRLVTTEMRPAVLDKLGLWGALEWHINKLVRRTGLTCDFRVDEPLAASAIGAKRELAIYRIVLEAVTNVERHAAAWQLTVHATRDAKQLCVVVADDGVGVGEARQAAHLSLGIRGMRERARMLGGAVALHSEFNKGTVVRLTMPLGDGDGD